ncbi:MAG: ATP-binding protein [Actinoplanes sp.]
MTTVSAGVYRPGRGRSGSGPTLLIVAAQGAAAGLTLWLAEPGHSAWWAAGAAVLGTSAVQARARAAAYRAGRAAERARCLRSLHDTALQSLETMALAGDADRLSPAETLIEVRGTARRQAALLRRSLGDLAREPDGRRRSPLADTRSEITGGRRSSLADTLSEKADSRRSSPAGALSEVAGSRRSSPAGALFGEPSGRRWSSPAGALFGEPGGRRWSSLADALAEVAEEIPVEGPRVEVVAGADLPRSGHWQQDCLRDATREALTNVVKHAGARRVVVRLAAAGDGVEVVVRDDGRGFDPAHTTPGFGTRQSITARIREAGGEATIESWPGHGTRVRLWMPGALTTTHPRRRPRR